LIVKLNQTLNYDIECALIDLRSGTTLGEDASLNTS